MPDIRAEASSAVESLREGRIGGACGICKERESAGAPHTFLQRIYNFLISMSDILSLYLGRIAWGASPGEAGAVERRGGIVWDWRRARGA